jgi:hypothetical protein
MKYSRDLSKPLAPTFGDEPKKRKNAPTPQEIQAARQKRLDNKLARKKTKAEIAKVKSNKRASDQSNRRNGKKEHIEHRRKMEVLDTLYKK